MVTGYVGELIWFGLLKLALAFGFSAPEGSSVLRRVLAYCFTVNGEGLDPSYVTFFVPLIVVPVVSLITTEERERKTIFYAILSGDTKVERALGSGPGLQGCGSDATWRPAEGLTGPCTFPIE